MSPVRRSPSEPFDLIKEALRILAARSFKKVIGFGLMLLCIACALAISSWSVQDPSLNHALANNTVQNWLGRWGAIVADLMMQFLGLSSTLALIVPTIWGWRLLRARPLENFKIKLACFRLQVGGCFLRA
jgi:DNA segregation ATPase FtsK/SpoIIIE, S-DNA-T family